MTAAKDTPPTSRVRALPRTCVLFALPHERKLFKYGSNQDIRVAHSGAGADNAARVASSILAAYDDAKPSLIICGFGGGLTPSMKTGDLIVSEAVLDATDGVDYVGDKLIPDPQLATIALEQRVPGARIHKGALITTNRVLTTAHEKREWYRRTGAMVVDMETAGAAGAAIRSGAPWVSVRVVTDDSENDLPLNFNSIIDAEGNISIVRATLACLLRPWTVPAMMRLGRSSSLAGTNLALFLESFLRQLPLTDKNTAPVE